MLEKGKDRVALANGAELSLFQECLVSVRNVSYPTPRRERRKSRCFDVRECLGRQPADR